MEWGTLALKLLSDPRIRRLAVRLTIIGAVVTVFLVLAALMFGSMLMTALMAGSTAAQAGGWTPAFGVKLAAASQPAASAAGRASIPANYLQLYRQMGQAYG